MPIYVYQCSGCNSEQEVLQKISDTHITECPKCGSTQIAKKLTTAGFALKGSGWYATDFKGTPVKSAPAEKPSTPCGGSCACHPTSK